MAPRKVANGLLVSETNRFSIYELRRNARLVGRR